MLMNVSRKIIFVEMENILKFIKISVSVNTWYMANSCKVRNGVDCPLNILNFD